MCFTSRGTGWVSGGGVLSHTTDGCAHWTSQLSVRPTVIGLAFADSRNGWAIAGDVYHTTNGGAQWLRQTAAQQATWGFALTPSNAVIGLRMPYGSSLSRTSDGGATWQSSTRATDGYFGSLSTLQFVDAATGWAAGEAGEILATTDGGVAWSAQASNVAQNLKDVDFIDADDGWSVGDQGVIVHTTDGGATWAPQTSGVADDLAGVTFVDAQRGWVVGGNRQ